MSILNLMRAKYTIQDNSFKTFQSDFLDVLYHDSRDFSDIQIEQFKSLIDNFDKYISANDKEKSYLDSIQTVRRLNKSFTVAFSSIFNNYYSDIQLRENSILNFCQNLIELAKSIVQQDKDDYNSVFDELDGTLSNLRLQLLDLDILTIQDYIFGAFKIHLLEILTSYPEIYQGQGINDESRINAEFLEYFENQSQSKSINLISRHVTMYQSFNRLIGLALSIASNPKHNQKVEILNLKTSLSDLLYFTQQNLKFENFAKSFFKILTKNDNRKQFSIDTYNYFQSLMENFLLFISNNDKDNSSQTAMEEAVANLNPKYCDSFKDIFKFYLSDKSNQKIGKKESRKTTMLIFCNQVRNLTLQIINPDLSVCQNIRDDLDWILYNLENELLSIDIQPRFQNNSSKINDGSGRY